ncbi:zinc ribbon domain-containing protein [Candidatus Peregrinibacteria bacterium]|nr:zinc ribbon domain-containing protein [Candidatus Peregrinibacteria bacterium]
MPPFLTTAIEFISSPTFGIIQIVAISYIGLLWLSIIIWVTRDSINRSSSLLFQTFSIIINIAIPILGVIFYLIIRPSKTNIEKYYEEIEHRMIADGDDGTSCTCEKCLTVVSTDYSYCPNCSAKLKKICTKCKKGFPSIWNICPYCGSDYEKNENDDKTIFEPKRHKRITKKSIKK